MKHYSVLLKECIEGLNIKENGIYVDGTLGRGGHSIEILKRIPHGHLYAFDRDIDAIHQSRERLDQIGSNYTLIHSKFSNLRKELHAFGTERFDGMLLDLGVSSPQFDEAKRGFSYRFDADLDMRMDQSESFSAYDVVNTYTYEQLIQILYQYSDEMYAKAIAKQIIKSREIKSIKTTFELVDIIKQALPMKVLNKKGHPAKKVFQAIRMEVNKELEELEIVLKEAIDMLNAGGRLCVITFHSIEDRVVKEAFQKVTKKQKVNPRLPILEHEIRDLDYRLVCKKPMVADEEELLQNNRSHSAKLRILERIR